MTIVVQRPEYARALEVMFANLTQRTPAERLEIQRRIDELRGEI